MRDMALQPNMKPCRLALLTGGFIFVLLMTLVARGSSAAILVIGLGSGLIGMVIAIRYMPSEITRHQKRFLIIYVLALLSVFSPSKAIGQLSVLFFLFGFVFVAQVSIVNHLIKFSALVLLLSGMGIFYAIVAPDFFVVSYLVFLVTASSFALLLCNFTSIATPQLISYVAIVSIVMLGFQSCYGIIQAVVAAMQSGTFDISNGDFVRGTIDPSFQPVSSASNPIFAILISSLLIFTAGTERSRPPLWRVVIYGLILLVWLLASVMHTIFFFVIAAVLALVVSVRFVKRNRNHRRNSGLFWGFLGSIIFVVGMVPIVLPRNFVDIPIYITLTVNIGAHAHSEKARATYNTVVLLPDTVPFQPIIGLGPGHYSSRASLIMSGEYIQQSSLSFLPDYRTQASERFILPLWRSFLVSRPGGGSTYHPFYSWLSLYGEFGLLGMVIIGIVVGWLVLRLRYLVSQEFPFLHLAMLVLLFYLGLLGFQDNYWEFTQAVFPAFLLFKLSYDYLRVERIRSWRVV